MKLVFDIEANGLLPTVSKFHCAGARDVDTKEEYWFRPDEFKSFLKLLDKADTIIAHNAFGYDIPALGILSQKLLGYVWYPKATVQCTKVMSQLLNYRRFGFGHSLKLFGNAFGDQKGDYTGGWEEFNEDMLSKGIYMAMTTTVAGLIVGIIAFIAYNYLVSKVDKVVFMLEAKTTEFLDVLHHNE